MHFLCSVRSLSRKGGKNLLHVSGKKCLNNSALKRINNSSRKRFLAVFYVTTVYNKRCRAGLVEVEAVGKKKISGPFFYNRMYYVSGYLASDGLSTTVDRPIGREGNATVDGRYSRKFLPTSPSSTVIHQSVFCISDVIVTVAVSVTALSAVPPII